MHVNPVSLLFLLLSSVAVAQAPLIAEDFSGAGGATPPPGWSITTRQGGAADGFRFDNPASRPIPLPLQAPVAIVDSDLAGFIAIDTELHSPTFDASNASSLELRWNELHIPLLSTIEVAVTTPTGRSVVFGPTTAGSLTPRSLAVDITAACNGASQCRVSWRYIGFFDWYWEIDDVVVSEPSVIDVGVTAVTSPAPPPADCTPLGPAEVVSVNVTNHGSAALPAGTLLPVSYRLNGGAPIAETHTTAAVLSPGATTNIVFTTTADLSMAGSHTLDAFTLLGGDSNPTNDALNAHVITGPTVVTTFPFAEDFDALVAGSTTPPPGWVNDATDVPSPPGNDDWIVLDGPTPSAGTGPAADHTSGTGNYVYVEDSFPGEHAAVSLLTPCLDLTALTTPALEFHRHGLNVGAPSEENALSVDAIVLPSGMIVNDVVAPLGDTATSAWVATVVDLQAFTGGVVRLRFRASTSNSGGFGHDLAIDDVRVFDLVVGAGQPPSSGIAALDVNDALERNGLPVSSGLPGPYTAAASTGGTVDLVLAGEPHQPIVLFVGPSNPGLIDFGVIGSLDVGLPDGAGGATSIGIVGDGTGSGLLDALFVIPPGGVQSITFTVPTVLSGSVLPLQMIALNTTFALRLSNSVILSVS